MRLHELSNRTAALQRGIRCARYTVAGLTRVVAYVPFDDAISETDRAGIAVIDHDPHAPAVAAIWQLADWLGRII